MSALPPKADIGTQSRNVRFVPKADIGISATRLVFPITKVQVSARPGRAPQPPLYRRFEIGGCVAGLYDSPVNIFLLDPPPHLPAS